MQISSNYNVSFGHIYSQALDTVLKNNDKMTKKQEAQLAATLDKAAALKKSVITSSTTKGFILLTSNSSGSREIYKTYLTGYDTKTNIEQLKEAVKDAETLEKSDLADISPVKKAGKPENQNCNYPQLYNKTINGYSAKF